MSEDAILASGVSHYKYQRFDLYRVNPPFVRLLAAFPVKGELLLQENVWRRYNISPLERSEFVVGLDVVCNHPEFKRLIFHARLLTILFFGLVGVLVCFFCGKQFSGLFGGFIVILLWCFSPYVLGHGSTIMNDLPAAAMAISSIYFFWQWLKSAEMLEAFIAGIVLGFAELTKFTLLIFYPLFIILWLFYRLSDFRTFSRSDWLRQIKQFSVVLIISVVVINMCYIFEGSGKFLGSYRFQTKLFTGYKTLKDIPLDGGNRFANTPFAYIPVPLPANFVQGIDTQRLDFERGLQSYLRGEWSEHGWGYYYFYALLVKIPLGVIGLFLLAIFCTFFQKDCNVSWRDEMVILLPGLVLLLFVSSQSGFSVHSRYVIPALPFLFIWTSKVGKVFLLRKRFLQVLVLIFLVWSIFSSLWIYPHSISYFNELSAILPTPKEPIAPQEPAGRSFIVTLLNSGARNGGRHLLDSNIDWGQDIFYLERWRMKHSEIKEIYTALYSSYPLEKTKIPSKSMPLLTNDSRSNWDPKPGWYAISVNHLYDRERQYRHFLKLKPIDSAGYSIYIYHVTQEDANHLRKKIERL
jgi:hypothetical protein